MQYTSMAKIARLWFADIRHFFPVATMTVPTIFLMRDRVKEHMFHDSRMTFQMRKREKFTCTFEIAPSKHLRYEINKIVQSEVIRHRCFFFRPCRWKFAIFYTSEKCSFFSTKCWINELQVNELKPLPLNWRSLLKLIHYQ